MREEYNEEDFRELDPCDQYMYDEYIRLGGESNSDVYIENLEVFISLTHDSFICGGGSKKYTYRKWIKYIGSKKEADLYFKSIDNVERYS